MPLFDVVKKLVAAGSDVITPPPSAFPLIRTLITHVLLTCSNGLEVVTAKAAVDYSALSRR